MIILYKNTDINVHRRLKYTLTNPFIGVFLTNKNTSNVSYFELVDISTSDNYQTFVFDNIAADLDVASYNYKFIETNDTTPIPIDFNVLEIGLLQIEGVDTCADSTLFYDDVDVTNYVYYNC